MSKENPKIKIIIPTLQSFKEWNSTVFYQTVERFSPSLEVIYENTLGLSLLYNHAIERYKDSMDYLVFLHDDVEVHDAFFFDKLQKAHEVYNIVGLAGAINQDYTTANPSVWHLSSKNGRVDSRGFVSHFIPKGWNGVQLTHVNSAYFGPTPHEVSVIDGLMMSVDLRKIRDLKSPLFDNDFNWHHYDMAMCLNAKQNNLSIGVWPIFVIHHGLGEFQNQEWENSNKLFKQKYGHICTSI